MYTMGTAPGKGRLAKRFPAPAADAVSIIGRIFNN